MTQGASTSPYWYGEGDHEARRLLEAVRTFRRADEVMRQRASRDMDMNVTDLRALRFVIEHERAHEPVTPRALSAYLDISTAATTKLVDRLCASAHIERRPHPTDRRSVVLVPTAGAHHEVRDRLSAVHARMLQVARAVPPHARAAVREFLLAMAAEVEREHDGAASATAVDHQQGSPGATGTPDAPVD